MHHYMPASRNFAFDASAVIRILASAVIAILARDIAFDANAVKLAGAGRQWCLFIYIGVWLSQRYLAP